MILKIEVSFLQQFLKICRTIYFYEVNKIKYSQFFIEDTNQ